MTKSIGDRMKEYEAVSTSTYLMRRTPVIIRLDGKAFHTLSGWLESPYDNKFHECMCRAAMAVCSECQGARFAYHFSDEISVLLADYQDISTDAYFAYNLQKIVSVAASICTAAFAMACIDKGFPWCPPFPNFDCRAFNIPPEEVCNYFIWRQQDCTRNSIQTLARSLFSHKELHGKDSSAMQDMMVERGVNWNDQTVRFKRGIGILKGLNERPWVADYNIPIFTQDRTYVEGWVFAQPTFSPTTHENSEFLSAEELGFLR